MKWDILLIVPIQKKQMRNAAKSALTSKLSSHNLITTASNSEFLAKKMSLGDENTLNYIRHC